ncbi:hypothetical protein AAMO2058_000469700 [Amorphochlora amoebiformis]|eukprot:425969-Amorphochlora_amoeboformis.AAC.1
MGQTCYGGDICADIDNKTNSEGMENFVNKLSATHAIPVATLQAIGALKTRIEKMEHSLREMKGEGILGTASTTSVETNNHFEAKASFLNTEDIDRRLMLLEGLKADMDAQILTVMEKLTQNSNDIADLKEKVSKIRGDRKTIPPLPRRGTLLSMGGLAGITPWATPMHTPRPARHGISKSDSNLKTLSHSFQPESKNFAKPTPTPCPVDEMPKDPQSEMEQEADDDQLD